MRSILVGIPVIYCEDCVYQCIKSVESQADEVFIIDNNSTVGIKEIISGKNVLTNSTNVFVNPAWNQIMEKFLTSAHDYLIILNSDLVLKPGILNKIRETDIDYEKTIMLPNPVNEFSVNPPDTVNEIPGGFPGIMIVLSKEMCRAVYPIPTGLKLWFGDDWIFGKLKKLNYTLNIYSEMEVIHINGGSRSVFNLPNYTDIIEEDKVIWETVKHLINI